MTKCGQLKCQAFIWRYFSLFLAHCVCIGLGGPRWKEQRRFAARALKDLSEGQKGKYVILSILLLLSLILKSTFACPIDLGILHYYIPRRPF